MSATGNAKKRKVDGGDKTKEPSAGLLRVELASGIVLVDNSSQYQDTEIAGKNSEAFKSLSSEARYGAETDTDNGDSSDDLVSSSDESDGEKVTDGELEWLRRSKHTAPEHMLPIQDQKALSSAKDSFARIKAAFATLDEEEYRSSEDEDYEPEEEAEFSALLNKFDQNIVQIILFKVPMIGKIEARLPNLRSITIYSETKQATQVPWLPALLLKCQSTLESITLCGIKLDNMKSVGAENGAGGACAGAGSSAGISCGGLRLTALKSLDLIWCEGDHSNIIAGGAGNLERLLIKDPAKLQNKKSWIPSYLQLGINKALPALDKLSQLDLSDCWDAEAVAVIIEKSAATLQQLNLYNVDLSKTTGFASSYSGMFPDSKISLRKVKSASIKLCKLGEELDDNDLSVEGWTSLENLEIQYTKDISLSGNKLSKLKSLTVEYVGQLKEQEFTNLYRTQFVDPDCTEYNGGDPNEGSELRNFEDFLSECSALKTLSLKGIKEAHCEDDSDEEDDTPNCMKKIALKTLTLEDCDCQPFTIHLLAACRSTLETLTIKDMDFSDFRKMKTLIRFPNLKKMVLRPRYTSPRVRAKRSLVNSGMIFLVSQSLPALQNLELDSLMDVVDLKDLRACISPQLKVKITDIQKYCKSDLHLINNLFGI